MRIRYDADGTIWIPRPDVELEAILDKQYARVGGHLRWDTGSPPSLINDILDFGRTIVSGQVSAETLETRKRSCEQCPALVRTEKGSYCGGCRCGTWQLAKLDGAYLPKLGWAGLRCPLGRPGFHGSSPG